MAKTLPAHADVVIIGGGIIGCSTAYHLTKLGITDVVLLERQQLTSGTTWHAAGLVGQLRATRNMTELAQYTSELMQGLEAETGQATGFKQNGSISVALLTTMWGLITAIPSLLAYFFFKNRFNNLVADCQHAAEDLINASVQTVNQDAYLAKIPEGVAV